MSFLPTTCPPALDALVKAADLLSAAVRNWRAARIAYARARHGPSFNVDGQVTLEERHLDLVACKERVKLRKLEFNRAWRQAMQSQR